VRKLLSALLAIALVVTLVPAGLIPQASAADPATYFIPDNSGIRNTALRVIDGATSSPVNPNQLTRDNAYTTTIGTLTITGTFSYVSAASMNVKIEQLNLKPNNNWEPDTTRFTTGTVQEEQGSANKFRAPNLTLFPGMNRITFSGMQGSIQRSDVFYVLYDQIPYIESLKVISGSSTFNLNEGSRAVVPVQMITLQGIARNANKATVSLNDGVPIVSQVYEDGTLFTPALTLKSGNNKIKLSITNGTNTINITRELYFFDTNKPFTEVNLLHHTSSYSILDNTPQVTSAASLPVPVPGETGKLEIKMLVPYHADPFAGNATYTLNGSASTPIVTVVGEETIPGSDGITPQYRLVTFETPNSFAFEVNGTSTAYTPIQKVNLTVTYKSFSTSFEGRFNFVPGDTVIDKIQYLPKYDGTSDVTTSDKEPLNGAQVDSPDFYILVDTNVAPTGNLVAQYLPTSSASLTVAPLAPQPAGTDPKKIVYRVTNFAVGQQKVQFKYDNSTSAYVADISYASKSYIYVANLYDGQTYTFNSKVSGNFLKITGEFMGFKEIEADQYFINGVAADAFDPPLPALDVSVPTPSAPDAAKFSITLNIGGEGPLVFGENRIMFKGVNKNGGVSQEIIKEIRIYLIDENVSTIKNFSPGLSASTREAFQFPKVEQYTEQELANIFTVPPEFSKQNDEKYVTSETKYDLVLRGSGATILNIKRGSKLIFTQNIPLVAEPTSKVDMEYPDLETGAPGAFKYDFAGEEKDFILRLRDFVFEAPGSHVYTLELINSTGARSTQILEVMREVSPFRVLAPKATVGEQILVNKNFVHFDIEAEGATEVLIGKEKAVKREDLKNRFVLDYIGLKADKLNPIKIQIKRADTTLDYTVNVYYSSTVQVDTQFMQKLATKFDVFNKKVQLTFPKGTVLKAAKPNALGVSKLYYDTNILFGIADPSDGVVERRNDYGNIINVNNDDRTYQGLSPILIPSYLVARYGNNTNTFNFTPISPTYWISGGVGELGNRGEVGYKPAVGGLAPYSTEGRFTEYPLERKVIPSNRGKLTLKFDTNVVDEAGYTVTVFRYTDNGNWQNIGGEVNTKNHTITVPFDDFGYYRVVKLRKGFTDITNHSWARNILNALYSKGIMKNIRTDEFGANDTTNRGEFATLLVKGLNLPLNYEGAQTFFDIGPGVSTDTWSYEYIETAARAGIVTGLDEGFFGPGLPVTRQEAAVMIARALKLKMPVNNKKLEDNLAKSFVDSGLIQYYARPAVEAVNKAKIMSGSPMNLPGEKKPVYNFNPRGNMTRAEAGKIAVALLQKSTSIFPKNLS